jgi:hypothetical protein
MPVDNKVSPSIMPSEISFKHQIEQTCSVLAKFEAIAAVGFPAATQLCETGRVVKSNPKCCNVLKPMESVVFWNFGNYHILHHKINSTH